MLMKPLIFYLQGINCYFICRNRNNTLDENVKTELRAITMNDLVKAVERALPGSSPTLKTWIHPGVLLQPCYILLTHLSTRMQDLVEDVRRTTSNAALHRWPCAEVLLSTAVFVFLFQPVRKHDIVATVGRTSSNAALQKKSLQIYGATSVLYNSTILLNLLYRCTKQGLQYLFLGVLFKISDEHPIFCILGHPNPTPHPT